jgi:hypothetical protein
MSELSRFCEERKLTKEMADAFVMYCRSAYSSQYALKNGETVKGIVDKLTRDEVLSLWQNFVVDFKNTLLSK